VAGGYYDSTLHGLSSGEVFDPATNTFSSAGIGSMSAPRSGAAAAPLGDGRVLIVGGYPIAQPLVPSSAEVFYPATNSFSSAGIGQTFNPRYAAAAAPLPGGGVLVAGGGAPSDWATAEVFTPVSCRGKPATIVGHGPGEHIFGTDKADVIIGTPDIDKISGFGGNDLICGGQGDDKISGGPGNDRLYGQQGNDRLYGNRGDDRLKGGPGKDVLKGGRGKDKQLQ
jgi:Ca2+-binding RTX toxin-like protein